MPTAPRGPCPVPRCPELQPCSTHRRGLIADTARGTAAQRGYDAQHRTWRAVILARDAICKDPDQRHLGRVVPATVADHIVPLDAGGSWAYTNGQGLCRDCHNAKTVREREARRARGDSR